MALRRLIIYEPPLSTRRIPGSLGVVDEYCLLDPLCKAE